MSAWYVGDARGSGIVYSVANVIWIRGIRGVGGVCEMRLCLVRGGVGGEGVGWMRGLGLGFTNPVGTRGRLTCVWIAVV